MHRRYIDYTLFPEYQEKMEEAFPYMHPLEVSRFVQLIFHEITNQLHEKRSINIPFFGKFYVRPVKRYKAFRRDVWNGYAEWVSLKTPLEDWVPCFEPSPYLQHISTNRHTQMCKDEEHILTQSKCNISTTYRWDKAYLKFKKRDDALRECPYSLTTMGWSGYKYERIIKEGVHRGETILLTANDGEVYNIQDGIDGNHKEKFEDAYRKTRDYFELVAARKIHMLRKKNHLKKIWHTTYSKYLNEVKYKDVQEIESMLKEKRKDTIASFFYALRFGYSFEIGEKKKLFCGYIFSNKHKE